MDVTADPAVLARARALPRRLSTTAALALLVGGSAVVRVLLSLGHDAPIYLPDEYLYAELARTLAETGLPRVRGELAHFPGLFQPLVTAPFWLPGDPALALRATQVLHALAMSAAAVPVYVTARALALSSRTALAAAGVSLAAPGLAYSAFVLSDAIGYALATAALWAGVRALDRPARGREAAFLALAALAAFTRLQYLALPAAFALCALVLEGRRAPRRFPVTAAAGAAVLAGAAVVGPWGLLGTYSNGARAALDVGEAAAWLPTNAMLFAYAAGWAIVPGAVVGLAHALARPRTRAERAFGVLAGGLATALFGLSARIAELDTHRFQERYLIALVPATALAFGLGWERRGRPGRLAAAAGALGLLVVAVRVPTSGYVGVPDVADSPTLWAVRRLAIVLGSTTDAATVVVAAATVLALAAAAWALRAGSSPVPLLALAAAALAALSLGAHVHDAGRLAIAKDVLAGAPRDWVDRAGLGSVTLVQPRGSSGQDALAQLFWNRSVADVVLLPGARDPDTFGGRRAEIAGDGRIVVGSRPLEGSLLVDTAGAVLEAEGAEPLPAPPGFSLLRSLGAPRLRMLALGRYTDGWLAGGGTVTLWPSADGRTTGTLELELSLPPGFPQAKVTFEIGRSARTVVVAGGGRTAVSLAVDGAGPQQVGFAAQPIRFDGRRFTSVLATEPVFRRR